MAANHFDLIVLGSGPAGERGAAYAASLGKKVALVERESTLGGMAARLGTLPSKVLRETAQYLAGFRQRGIRLTKFSIDDQLNAPDLLHRERLVRQLEQARLRAVVEQGRIALFHGAAHFVDAHTVRVRGALGGFADDELLSADRILVATGSSPVRPPQFQVDDPAVFDSEGILNLGCIPRTLAVAGGGVVGVEYAAIFAALGVKVTLLEEGDRLLPFLDGELSRALLEAMRAQEVDVRLGERVAEVRSNDELTLVLANGAMLQTECLLVSAGRAGNTGALNLAAAGLEADERGFLSADENGQTSVPGIYAAGDVRGFPALASAAREQSVVAMRHAFGGESGGGGSGVPLYGIYTIPECAMAGETEEALRARGVPLVVGKAHYPANVRGQILGARSGFLKLLFHHDNLQLLGVHIIGEQASELIHLGMAALQTRAKARFLAEGSYNYPTLSELYRAAALDAVAKCFTTGSRPAAPRIPGLRPQ